MKLQSRMDNPEMSATLSTQDKGRRQITKKNTEKMRNTDLTKKIWGCRECYAVSVYYKTPTVLLIVKSGKSIVDGRR